MNNVSTALIVCLSGFAGVGITAIGFIIFYMEFVA